MGDAGLREVGRVRHGWWCLGWNELKTLRRDRDDDRTPWDHRV
jgi:hypothetical protein